MCAGSGQSSGGYSQPSYGGSGGYGQPMQQGYGGPNGQIPGWGRPFSYSPNAGPAYQRPQWPGSLPSGYNPIPPTTPGGGGTPPPPPPGSGDVETRPPGTGAQLPIPPPYPNAPPRDTRVSQPTWGAPQPYQNFPQFTQPGNVNSVGPATYPGAPAEGMQTPPPNPNTPPIQPPGQTRPGLGAVPKFGTQQGQLISDNFSAGGNFGTGNSGAGEDSGNYHLAPQPSVLGGMQQPDLMALRLLSGSNNPMGVFSTLRDRLYGQGYNPEQTNSIMNMGRGSQGQAAMAGNWDHYYNFSGSPYGQFFGR